MNGEEDSINKRKKAAAKIKFVRRAGSASIEQAIVGVKKLRKEVKKDNSISIKEMIEKGRK